jgi:aminoglycoside phosphotransferase family enzyme/predicted kinase
MTASGESEADAQRQVFAFLLGLSSDPPVHRIDTHAASVFLVGSRALKIKRAVRFAFLDYSTLARRKAACEAEIAINRRFAPQIYHRVVAITRDTDGSLGIDGKGTPVEYAVAMTRFDESQTIDHLAEAGQIDAILANDIANTIAASHAKAVRAATGPWIQSIPSLIAGNTAALRSAAMFRREAVDELDAASQSEFSRNSLLLERRGQQGFVRQCHGDLHLGNIVLIERKPVLFDAIEFDPALASTDVLYDLAFPLMELLHYRREAAANLLLNRYLARTPAENGDALATLPLFMSIRAAVRAKVLHDRLAQDCDDRAAVAATAAAYFDLAHRLIHPPPPKLVAVGGLSGTGKSVLARDLAAAIEPPPGAVVLRSDIVRKQHFHANETDRLPPEAYQPETTRKIYEMLAHHAGKLLSQGHSVVVDAVFAHPSERAAIREVARALDVPFAGLFLVADLATRMKRVGQRAGDASDATPEIAALQEGFELGTLDWASIDASGTPEQTLIRSRSELTGDGRSIQE